jgi:apolipoprotein N-acyltransferase
MADLTTQFFQRPKWVRFAGLAILGAFAGLGQAPTDLWYVTVLAFAVVFRVYHAITPARQSAVHIWAFGFGYFAFSLRWIIEPFLVDIARHGWMAPFALVFMGAGAALFWAIAAGLAARVAPRSGLMLALFLVGAEVLRSLILTGFPWALIGHIWTPTYLAQLAAFGGPHLLSLVTVIAALSVAALAGKGRLAGLSGLVGLVVFALVVRPSPAPTPRPDLPVVRLVQPNAPQHQKWDPAFRDVFLDRMIRLTGEGDVPDLVVWPETAVPYLLNYIADDLGLLSDAARGAPLVFGIQRRDQEGLAYNSLVVMGPGGMIQSIYDKRHLVPFGEYIPGARLLGRLGATGLAGNLGMGFAPGAQAGPVVLPGIGRATALICYEGIFAEEVGSGSDRPRLLLLITNDAWFGKAAGPYQHLAQARLRAIEQGLPMVRAANTGISAMIDAKGRITASLPLGVDGAIDVPLPRALPATVYSVTGDWPLFALLVLLGMFGYWRGRRDGN